MTGSQPAPDISGISDPVPVTALIPAAGIGTRMQCECPKQYLIIAGKTILEHTLAILLAHPRISQVVVALHPDDTVFRTLPVAQHPRIRTVTGGGERADSVLAGLDYLAAHVTEKSWVLVHDAARPCLHISDLNRLLAVLSEENMDGQIRGAILASPVRDTMKRGVTLSGHTGIDHTVDRTQLWHALTPQFFPLHLLRTCLQQALSQRAVITDEASALEFCGYQPLLVTGRADNIKVTQPEDLVLAGFYLSNNNKE
ncbi:2-C-methyl-D-erythritol 4-phosphate cytidylyltransferase [Morganella psychrotolerans]|uniref:2-C-methyl-D-erythritol 4-phosphate cytidylyltransferase n=1 Tax=Morganella psychrotolerans TaxID=368603 RepID=UPI0039B119EB